MSNNPFDPLTEETLNRVIRWMERSYILGLVSFLPKQIQEKIILVQEKIGTFFPATEDDVAASTRKYIEIQPGNAFHFTQLLLRFDRDGSRMPIRMSEIAKSKNDLLKAFGAIRQAVSEIKPFHVVLDKAFLIGTLIGVTGYCDDTVSVKSRHTLLSGLSKSLLDLCDLKPRILNITERGRQSDPEEFQEVHCTFGVVKRNPPLEFGKFKEAIYQMEFEPISFVVDSVSLVHTRFLSYAPPQEGIVTFKLGEYLGKEEDEILSSLRFV